jgi:hypothetical protein
MPEIRWGRTWFGGRKYLGKIAVSAHIYYLFSYSKVGVEFQGGTLIQCVGMVLAGRVREGAEVVSFLHVLWGKHVARVVPCLFYFCLLYFNSM